MRGMTLALAAAWGPAVTGCSILETAARNAVHEPQLVATQWALESDLRRQAREAWRQVRVEYPRRAFTAEFRDGFLDGFVDYLDRGGNGSLPAVPPAKYVRQKKYFTEEGQCLLKDYFLGFQYGQEVAIATGRRQYLTVPVLLPKPAEGPPAFRVVPRAGVADSSPSAPPGGTGGASLPAPRPVAVPGPSAPEVGVPAPPTGPTNLPAHSSGSDDSPGREDRPAGTVPVGPTPPVPPAAPPPTAPSLPPPPAEVPELPPHVPTPSVLDELPVVLPAHTLPPPVLPVHPEK